MPLAALQPLSRIPGVQLFSLQRGPGLEQLRAAAKWRAPIKSVLNAEAGDAQAWEELAAVVANLDLVISVDTAPAHLAGAMDVPVWIALAAAPDWRWMLERTDSPWYPSAQLFRQKRLGEWDDVVASMATELQTMVGPAAPASPRAE
jgi:hypothetical protein